MTQKEKMKKSKIIFDKSISGIWQNISIKTTSKKYLPKLKQFYRKNSMNHSHPFNINLHNNNNVNNNNEIANSNKKNNKSLSISKLMIVIKEKTPERKNHLKSINNRLPSAIQSKVKDFFSININNSANLKPNQIFLIPNKFENNICLDDINYQIINLNEISKSNIMPNIVRHSGKDIIKKIINNDINNNFENKENKLNHSCKKVTFFLKQRIKGIKLKRDRFLNDVHKISINAQMSEINKSNK